MVAFLLRLLTAFPCRETSSELSNIPSYKDLNPMAPGPTLWPHLTFINKGLSSQSYGSSNSHIRMWELDYKESWAQKNWSFWTVVLEKILESPLDCKEIQSVYPKGNQSWIFIRRNDAEAEIPILWPPHAKSWLIWKDPDAGKDWAQEENGVTEDEMVRWNRWLNGQEFEQAPGVDDG